MTTKEEEEVLRLAALSGLYTSQSDVMTHYDGGVVTAQIAKLIELAKQAGAAEEREACALWYENFGYLLDELDIPDAIRNREIKG